MRGTPVSVPDVLAARDRRAEAQKRLLESYSCPVISFTMNIPGEIKRFPSSDLAFRSGLERIYVMLGEPVFSEIYEENTGIEALLVYDAPALELKIACEKIETESPVGRLFDMDVIGTDGVKLMRAEPRRCIVCGGPAAQCSRSRSHGLEAVSDKVHDILEEFTSQRLSELAVDALIREAELSPKPGLVDAVNNGSHADMNLDLFIKSARSLKDYFCKVASIAAQSDECMPRLVAAGLEAEKTMYEATGGVNTHKGAIYNLGLVTAALAACAERGGSPFERASRLAMAGNNTSAGSHGGVVREKYGADGARQEACSGFPSAEEGLKSLKRGEDAVTAFMRIMLVCNDTNLLYRGGEEGLRTARLRAMEYLAAPEEKRPELAESIDREFIEKNLSPGGSADMLACAFLLKETECLYE